jgi:Mrp family chromosome partitioning ATPase
MSTTEQAMKALTGVMDPELGRNIVDLGMVRDLRVEGGKVSFTLALTTMACPLQNTMIADAKTALSALPGVQQVDVQVAEMSPEDKRKLMGERKAEREYSALGVNNIKHVVAVMSGKGGVGKSLVSALLAISLRRRGLRVGLLDADITGPSIPKMFFGKSPQMANSPFGMRPAESQGGVKIMSINLLLPKEDDAVIWRGPLISGAIKQFWGDVFWGDLDALIVDLPPGTSDASLTVLQSLPIAGIVMVTTPQDLAGMVVRKAAQMAGQLGIPILGLVENMSYAVCPDCGNKLLVFGPSHADEVALRLGAPLLGRLPLDPEIPVRADAGQIEMYAADNFQGIAERLAAMLP